MTPAELGALTERLAELGFNMVFDVTLETSPWLRHAIREFQIYARFARVAKLRSDNATDPRWVNRLQATDNSKPYTGAINGTYDAALQPFLDHWHAENYRCPVVAELYVNNAKPTWPELGADTKGVRGNYWRYDDPRIESFVKEHQDEKDPRGRLQVRICDLSGMFESAHSAGTMVKSGRIRRHVVTSGKGKKKKTDTWVGGFVGDSRIVTPTAEVLPKTMIDQEWAQLTDSAKQTFRVVRAVSEQECLGYLQSINGYDDAWMSLGPCHWTLALAVPGQAEPDQDAGAGELPAFLAYWASTEPADASARLLEPFGIMPRPAWTNGEPPSKPGAICAYTGRLHWLPKPAGGSGSDSPIAKVEDLNWFRTTHWFWRFLALARNVKSFRLRQWHMTRIRIRDILAYEIDPSDRPTKPAGTAKVPVGNLVTSEAGVALLLRCHIRKSGFLAQGNLAHPSLRLALAFANISETDPNKWKDAEEKQLIQGLLASAAVAGLPAKTAARLKKLKLEEIHGMRDELAGLMSAGDLFDQCQKLLAWPDPRNFSWGRKGAAFKLAKDVATPGLRQARGSFTLDVSNLPT
ncbi:hypothetical protein [Solimonas sp. SE-A11]|uniref:hypothetical protein n=1 Tax=Solimonas sp. SE-A11 TaxID=3054954 RepID=UPI00259CA5D0|nr:hypothetical protein [Solimonas sp. SE-A11]MDM4769054.1 hypothetical protein [Solimonas sp. SE-A11]